MTKPADSPLRIRALEPPDQAFLWDILHVALWDPPPAPLRPREILEHPEVRIYAEDWGRHGDVGVVGELDGKPIGACWMRVLPDGKGLGYVDDETPQLGIALLPGYQRKGYGEQLMRAALSAACSRYSKVSLTVHPENGAIALYRRCGFVEMERRRTYVLMVTPLARNGDARIAAPNSHSR